MRTWRWITALGVTGAMLTGALGTGTASAAKTYVNWPQYLYSSSHTSDNTAATAITPANAAKLKLLWKFLPSVKPSGLSGFYSSPTVYNGVIYIGARSGNFYALNETTGAVIWEQFIGYVPHKTCGAEGTTSTAAVALDPTSGNPTVYVYGASGYLYAMNAATGANVWPPAEVGIPSTTKSDYYAWDSPLVLDGNIYVGISSQCDDPLVRAGLDKFSQTSGALETTFWTTPAGTRGASIWSSPATDGSSLFVTTGNGTAASLGYSLIQVNLSLTKQLGIWTVPPAEQVPDSDFGGSPGIWTASIGGTATEMVGACNKNGDFYAFQASDVSAGPVWTSKITNPYAGGGTGECDAAPLWDGSNLYLSSSSTTINGTSYDGSVRQVNPATGAYVWQTGVTGYVIGTPGMDGAGVIAAQTFASTTNQNGIFLIDASNGHLLKTLPFVKSGTFGQPVFADSDLFVASTFNGLRAYGVG